MKREFLWLTTALMLFFALESCRHSETIDPLEQEEEEETDYLTEDSLKRLISGKWRMEKFLFVHGTDTIDVEEQWSDHILYQHRRRLIFEFGSNVVTFADGGYGNAPEDRFKKPATFHTFQPRGMQLFAHGPNWDDEKKTMVFKSMGGGDWQLPSGDAYLVKSKLVRYKNWQEEEEASIPSCQMYKVDKPEGTYLYVLRQAHFVEYLVNDPTYYRFVVFP